MGGDGVDLQKPSNPFPSPSPVATIFLPVFPSPLSLLYSREEEKKASFVHLWRSGIPFLTSRGGEKRSNSSLPPLLSISLPTIPPLPSFRTKYWGRARNKTSPLPRHILPGGGGGGYIPGSFLSSSRIQCASSTFGEPGMKFSPRILVYALYPWQQVCLMQFRILDFPSPPRDLPFKWDAFVAAATNVQKNRFTFAFFPKRHFPNLFLAFAPNNAYLRGAFRTDCCGKKITPPGGKPREGRSRR